MTNHLRRADHPDARADAHTEYIGEIDGRAVKGVSIAGGISLSGDCIGVLMHRGMGRYVGPVRIGGVVHEAVASPEGIGIRRQWVVTLHTQGGSK